jgi:hypothetical protein
MSNELTIKLVALLKEHGIVAFEEASETATSIFGIFTNGVSPPKDEVYPVPQRRRPHRRKSITAAELAERTDWTGRIGDFFLDAEKKGLTEVPMRDVVDYVVKNTERNSVTGSAYGEYVKAAEKIGWRRSYTGKGGVKARTWVKV